MAGYSRKEKGFFGDEKMVHYDDDGRKVGESRKENTILGGEKTVHYDAYGKKTGESRKESSIFSGEKSIHYDESGKKIGESKKEIGWFGEKKIVHYDKNSNKIGESKKETSLFGDNRIRHYGSQNHGIKTETPNQKEHKAYRKPNSSTGDGAVVFLLLGLPLLVIAVIALSFVAWSTMDTASEAGRIMGPITISSAIIYLVLGIGLSIKFKGFGEVSPFAYGAAMWMTMFIADIMVEGAGEHPILGFLCAGIYSFLFAVPGIGVLAITDFVRSKD